MNNGSHLVVETPDDLFHLGLDSIDLNEFGLNHLEFKAGAGGDFHWYDIPDGEEVFSYIVLKLLLLYPFCVYNSQYPTQKDSIFKRNIVQLSDQPNNSSSNPFFKAHIVNQHS